MLDKDQVGVMLAREINNVNLLKEDVEGSFAAEEDEHRVVGSRVLKRTTGKRKLNLRLPCEL